MTIWTKAKPLDWEKTYRCESHILNQQTEVLCNSFRNEGPHVSGGPTIISGNLFPWQMHRVNARDGRAANRPSTTRGRSNAGSGGKTICTNVKASDMHASADKNHDLTQQASRRSSEAATRKARELENDDANETAATGKVDSPQGDDAAENRVATSLDNE